MKAFLLLFFLNLCIIFIKGDEDDKNAKDNTEWLRKKFPEKTFSSNGDESSDIKVDHSPEQGSRETFDSSYLHRRPVQSKLMNTPVIASSSSEENDVVPLQQLNQKVFLSAKVGKKNKLGNMDKDEIKQFKAEIKAGDMTKLFGINQHIYQPDFYPIYDLGRRFIPQYQYREVSQGITTEDDEDPSLIPERAPPELVLKIAKESELIHAAQPEDPNENILKKESLRTGNYWNTYWKEDVEEPENILRSRTRNKLGSVSAKLSPGTAIYDYISKLNKKYPKLLYVINKAK